MATKEELEKRAGDCQVTEDYISVVTDIVQDIDDKDWAGRVLNQGKEACKTGADYQSLAQAAVSGLGDKELSDKMLVAATALADKVDNKEEALGLLQLAEKKRPQCLVLKRWPKRFLTMLTMIPGKRRSPASWKNAISMASIMPIL